MVLNKRLKSFLFKYHNLHHYYKYEQNNFYEISVNLSQLDIIKAFDDHSIEFVCFNVMVTSKVK